MKEKNIKKSLHKWINDEFECTELRNKKEVQMLHGPFDIKSSDDDRYHPAWKRILLVSKSIYRLHRLWL